MECIKAGGRRSTETHACLCMGWAPCLRREMGAESVILAPACAGFNSFPQQYQ